MSRSKGNIRRGYYDANGNLVGGVEWRNGSFWGTYGPPALTAVPFGLQSEAEIKALNRLKDQTIHLGNFLAEAKRTIRMVGDRSYTIADQVLDFKRKHPKLWVQVKKWQIGNLRKRDWFCIPDLWLELQYGWKPLMSDIFGALQHLEKASRDDELLFSVKGTAKRTVTVPRSFNAISGSSKARFESFQNHSARVKLWYKLNSGTLAELSSLGLLNPVEIVWEITRFSFVVDWFLPIGPWLSSLTGDAGYSFKGGSCSVKSIADDRCMGVDWEPDNGPSHFRTRVTQRKDPEISGLIYRFTRTCYSTSPVPGVYFKNPLSTQHMLNGLALLAQAFKK